MHLMNTQRLMMRFGFGFGLAQRRLPILASFLAATLTGVPATSTTFGDTTDAPDCVIAAGKRCVVEHDARSLALERFRRDDARGHLRVSWRHDESFTPGHVEHGRRHEHQARKWRDGDPVEFLGRGLPFRRPAELGDGSGDSIPGGGAVPVPEPSALLIFAGGLLALAGPMRRRSLSWPDRRGDEATRARDRVAPLDARLAVKRAIDVLGAVLGLLLCLPVLAVAAVAIRMDSTGPVFFAQLRCGRGGRRFRMWKLRSMVNDAESQRSALEERNAMSGPVFKVEDDPRVTRVGRWLRRYSVDEIPQFWNVLRGDMSLVGPRPPLPCEVTQYGARERRRLEVKPGLTCTWQVSGRNQIDFDEWMAMDLDYIENWSLSRDLGLLLRTVPAVVSGSGAS